MNEQINIEHNMPFVNWVISYLNVASVNIILIYGFLKEKHSYHSYAWEKNERKRRTAWSYATTAIQRMLKFVYQFSRKSYKF